VITEEARFRKLAQENLAYQALGVLEIANRVRVNEALGYQAAISSGSIGSALMFVLFINNSILQQEAHG